MTKQLDMFATDCIRLGCEACERTDYDGIEERPASWVDVIELECVLDWETHVGLCPNCQDFTKGRV